MCTTVCRVAGSVWAQTGAASETAISKQAPRALGFDVVMIIARHVNGVSANRLSCPRCQS